MCDYLIVINSSKALSEPILGGLQLDIMLKALQAPQKIYTTFMLGYDTILYMSTRFRLSFPRDYSCHPVSPRPKSGAEIFRI